MHSIAANPTAFAQDASSSSLGTGHHKTYARTAEHRREDHLRDKQKTPKKHAMSLSMYIEKQKKVCNVSVLCPRTYEKYQKKVCNVFVHVYRKNKKKYAMKVFCVRVSMVVMQCYNNFT